MGLFDRFRRRKENAPLEEKKSPQEEIQEYSGLRVEVLTPEGEELFIAKLAISGGICEFQLIGDMQAPEGLQDAAVDEEGKPRPIPILARGYDELQQKAIHMEGEMLPYDPRIWRAASLRIVGKDNDRAYFRQDVGSAGTVLALSVPEGSQAGTLHGLRPDGGPMECRVVNISMGGVCIETSAELEPDSVLALRSRLLPDSEMAVMCRVCRVNSRRSGGMIEYGCKFEHLDPAMEDQLAKAIAKLQMKRMKR